jgi:hypothetical protein
MMESRRNRSGQLMLSLRSSFAMKSFVMLIVFDADSTADVKTGFLVNSDPAMFGSGNEGVRVLL